jgi:archaeal type IV pilus assembly protein PilA
MNIWGKSERSWRRKNRRAVSPIIATILLVAITVVLAAVLYILVQQYTKGGSTGTPLGGALSLGASSDSTKGTTNYYNFSVTSASSALTFTSTAFQVKTAGGTIVALTGTSTVTVISLTGTALATYTFGSGWASGTTGTLTNQDQLVLAVPTSAGSLVGNQLIVLGSGSFSGQITAPIS